MNIIWLFFTLIKQLFIFYRLHNPFCFAVWNIPTIASFSVWLMSGCHISTNKTTLVSFVSFHTSWSYASSNTKALLVWYDRIEFATRIPQYGSPVFTLISSWSLSLSSPSSFFEDDTTIGKCIRSLRFVGALCGAIFASGPREEKKENPNGVPSKSWWLLFDWRSPSFIVLEVSGNFKTKWPWMFLHMHCYRLSDRT